MDKLYTFHRTANSNGFMYQSLNDDDWSNEQSVQNQGGIDATPGAAVLNGVLYLFYGRGGIFYYVSTDDGDTFTDEAQVPNTGGLAAGVAAVTYNEKIYLFHTIPNDPALRCKTFDGTNWGPDEYIKSEPAAFDTLGTPAATVWDNKIYVLVRGGEGRDPRNQTRLWYAAYDGALWQTTQVDNTPGVLDGVGAAGFDGKLWVVFSEPSRQFVYKTFDGTSWSDDSVIPGTVGQISTPAAVVYNSSLYLLYQRRDQPGGFLYHSVDADGNWSTEAAVSNSAGISNGPAAVVFNA